MPNSRFLSRPRVIACLSLLVAAAAIPGTVRAADPEESIVTDRPDFVESSAVVGKGRLQVETSMAYERSNRANLRERATATPTLLRFGVSDSVEMRLESDGWVHAWTRGAAAGANGDVSGMADSSVGLKWHLRDGKEDQGVPALGVLLHADLPSGARRIGSSGVRPSLRGVAEWELPGELSLGVMPGLASERNEDGKRFTSGIFGITLGKAWTAQWRSFVELSAPRIARARDGGNLLNGDLGVAYLVSRNCQLDAAISRGLNRNTPDLSMTVGLSFKL